MGKGPRKKRHVIEIPDKEKHPIRYRWVQFRWRAAVMAVQYPVQLALVVALLVCLVPITMLINQSGTLQSQQETLHTQQGQITSLVTRIQDSRAAAVSATCGKINRATTASNAMNAYIQGLIVNGAKASKAFEHVYRQFGFPPYKKRLAQAEKQADGLDRFVLTPLDCQGLLNTVKRQTPSRSNVPTAGRSGR